MKCQARCEITAGRSYVTCPQAAVMQRAFRLDGWGFVVDLCSAHATLFDNDVTKKKVKP